MIVNLQQTPKDKKASLVIHAKCDEVMQGVLSKLGMNIPVYTRTDRVSFQIQQSVEPKAEKPSMRKLTFSVCNVHDPKAALPLIKTAQINVLKVSHLEQVSYTEACTYERWQSFLIHTASPYRTSPTCLMAITYETIEW